jgi:hypothetical protein
MSIYACCIDGKSLQFLTIYTGHACTSDFSWAQQASAFTEEIRNDGGREAAPARARQKPGNALCVER